MGAKGQYKNWQPGITELVVDLDNRFHATYWLILEASDYILDARGVHIISQEEECMKTHSLRSCHCSLDLKFFTASLVTSILKSSKPSDKRFPSKHTPSQAVHHGSVYFFLRSLRRAALSFASLSSNSMASTSASAAAFSSSSSSSSWSPMSLEGPSKSSGGDSRLIRTWPS